MKFAKKNNKSGMFLSIELVSVLVIVATLLAGTTAGIVSLIKQFKAYKIIQEYTKFSKAITSFKGVYGFYPGDLDISDLTGSLNNPTLKANQELISSYSPASYSALFTTSHTNHISILKSQLAFPQLSKAGFVDNEVNIAKCNNTNLGFPIADFSNQAAWVIGMDSINTSITDNNMPKSSAIYDNLVYSNFSNKPRLILFGYKNLSTCVIDTNAGNAGVVSADIAFIVDDKIDDGKPVSSYGIVHADAQISQNSCKITLTGGETVLDFDYQDSSNYSSNSACIMTFLVN